MLWMRNQKKLCIFAGLFCYIRTIVLYLRKKDICGGHMNKIMTFIGKIFDIPSTLLKNCGKVYLSSFFILLFTIVSSVAFKMTLSFFLMGMALFLVTFIMASHMIYTFAEKNIRHMTDLLLTLTIQVCLNGKR